MPSDLATSLDLLIGQWRGSPKLRALVQVNRDIAVEELLPALIVIRNMRLIDQAFGVHLDRVGRRLGVERPATTDPVRDRRFGFDDAGEPFDTAPFRGDAANDAVYPLPDAVYKRFLRARALALLSDGTAAALILSVRAVDPGATVQDRRNMHVRIVTARRALLELADTHRCLARNAGVSLDYADRGRFGFDDAGVPFDQGPYTPL